MKKVRMAAAVNKFTDRRRILAAVLAGLMLSAAGGAVWPSRLLAAESGEVPDFALVEAAGAMPEGGWPAAAANAAAAAGQSPGTTAAGTVIPAVAAVAEGSGGQGVPPGGGDQFVPEITGGVLVDGTQLQNSLDIISINGGKMLTMAIIKSKADAINASASLIQQVASGVRVYVVNKGTEYYLVISGNDPAVVEQARRDICFMFAIDENLPNMLLDIAATLKQFTESEAAQVGLPILPTTVTIGGQSGNIQFPATTWQWGPNATGSSTANNAQVTVSTYDPYQPIQLLNSYGIGRVMVAGSVTTHNGIACTIQNSDNMPIVVSQGGSNTSTNQAINSSVQITPTIISFDRQDPSQSLIKLNINTQLSVITNQNPIAGASYTTKTLTTTRIIRANGEPIVAGSFVTDQNMPGNYYVPILGQIPVLKWLFSYQTYNVQRELSMLFVSVKLVPQTQLMGS